MTPIDKKLFPMDFTVITPEEYMTISILGTRQYCLKEDLSTLPRCRRVQKVYVKYHSVLFYSSHFQLPSFSGYLL